VFVYSHESGTAAGRLADDVPEDVKQERREKLMVAQQQISLERNASFVGRRLQVLLEGSGDDLTVGRSYRDAPEIDGVVLIPEVLEPGQMVMVEVTKALEYDLIARVISD
jgi:ribosomal protein S12 methylthiotransferase